MKRRTFISLMSVMAAAGALSLAGCSSSKSASSAAANKLEAIQSNGKLVVALEGAWQPWSFHDESDTLVGYDVEVSRAIAEKLGVEPEYVESDWDSLFAGLDAGRYDLVCNGVEVTEERAKTYDFTTPYGYIHTALAVRKDNEDIKSFEDLAGKTTANSPASTYMELAESYELNKHPLHPYTKTLLSAVPVPDPEVSRTRQRIVLEGDVPSPVNPPSGCRFRTRCPYATERCAQEEPAFREVSPGHYAACHNLEQVK